MPETIDATESFVVEMTGEGGEHCDILRTYDADGDGFIVQDDVVRISQDYYDGKVSQADVFFVTRCFDEYGGDINIMCATTPEPEKKTPWVLYLILAGIAAVLLG